MATKKITELTTLAAASADDADVFVIVDVSSGTTHKMLKSELQTLLAPDASETTKGIVEKATTGEVTTGTDTSRFVTPAGAKLAAETFAAGGLELVSAQIPASDTATVEWTGLSGLYKRFHLFFIAAITSTDSLNL